MFLWLVLFTKEGSSFPKYYSCNQRPYALVDFLSISFGRYWHLWTLLSFLYDAESGVQMTMTMSCFSISLSLSPVTLHHYHHHYPITQSSCLSSSSKTKQETPPHTAIIMPTINSAIPYLPNIFPV